MRRASALSARSRRSSSGSDDHKRRRRQGPVKLTITIDGDARERVGASGPAGRHPGQDRAMPARTSSRSRPEPRPASSPPSTTAPCSTVEGVRDNLRVLLVSGEPHAGERTWRNMLKSDAAVDLVHFTILRPPEKQDGTPINELSLIAFPTRELFQEKLDQFDLIIFDRYQRRGVLPLLYLDNVARLCRARRRRARLRR